MHVAGVALIPDGGNPDLGLRQVLVGEADAMEDGLGAALGLGLGDASAVLVELGLGWRWRRCYCRRRRGRRGGGGGSEGEGSWEVSGVAGREGEGAELGGAWGGEGGLHGGAWAWGGWQSGKGGFGRVFPLQFGLVKSGF